MVLFHPIIHFIIVMDALARGCFALVNALWIVTQLILYGIQDFDWTDIIIETVPNAAATVADTFLQITITYLVPFILALVWPVQQQQQIQANRVHLREYAKFLLTSYGPRKALPASPTWPKHDGGYYEGLLAFCSTSTSLFAFPAIPQIWARRIICKATMPFMMLPAPLPKVTSPKPQHQSLRRMNEIWIIMIFLMFSIWNTMIMAPISMAVEALQATVRFLSKQLVSMTCTALQTTVRLRKTILGNNNNKREAAKRQKQKIAESLQAVGLEPKDFVNLGFKSLDHEFQFLRRYYYNLQQGKGMDGKVHESWEFLLDLKKQNLITTLGTTL